MDLKIKGLCGLWMVSLLSVLNLASASFDLRIIEAVRSLLEQQVDGATAMQWAAHRDDRAMAELLIGTGADVNAVKDYG
jgi:ankyrin repeat protein